MRSATICLALLLGAYCASAVFADTFGTGANQFNIDFVTIGNAGNVADTTGAPNPAGSVGYVFNIGKYEVSRDMVNKAKAGGGLGITLAPMDFVTGGPRPDMPATGISWNEAARFVNWLNTSEGHTAAYKFRTQPGDRDYNPNENILLWQAGDAGFDPENRFRNSYARYVISNVHEWYKAAFYDPSADRGAGGYWNYPTGSDSIPAPVANGMAAGTAVWRQVWEQGPADVTQAGGESPFGVVGLGGNAIEWEETEFDLVNDDSAHARALRGDYWANFRQDPTGMSASARRDFFASDENELFGFRVASLPVFVCGDFDKDIDVDSADLVDFLAAWTGEGGTGATRDRGDCDVDGDVDSADMLTFLSHWTGSDESVRVASVPEPASGSLVGFAITGLLLSHRRRRA